MEMIAFLITSTFAYLAGSVNFAILAFRLEGRGDPRGAFSGNPGVVNVYRQAGLLWAALVLVLDLAKAMVVSITALCFLEPEQIPLAGLALVAGNRYPCFHQFRGGKGVAGYLGYSIVVSPVFAALSAAVWVGVYAASRIPFIASFFMIGIIAAGMVMSCGYHFLAIAGTLATVAFIVDNHQANIKAFLAPPEKAKAQS
jgi:glycerol-3-phosphate acyltransferase PlsY